jgi:hypothetical protein
MREHRLLGLGLDTTLVRRNAPDSILAAEAARLQLPLFQTASLRRHCGTEKLYYTYDSHFTPAGNHLFAEGVYTEINTALRQLRRQKK